MVMVGGVEIAVNLNYDGIEEALRDLQEKISSKPLKINIGQVAGTQRQQRNNVTSPQSKQQEGKISNDSKSVNATIRASVGNLSSSNVTGFSSVTSTIKSGNTSLTSVASSSLTTNARLTSILVAMDKNSKDISNVILKSSAENSKVISTRLAPKKQSLLSGVTKGITQIITKEIKNKVFSREEGFSQSIKTGLKKVETPLKMVGLGDLPKEYELVEEASKQFAKNVSELMIGDSFQSHIKEVERSAGDVARSLIATAKGGDKLTEEINSATDSYKQSFSSLREEILRVANIAKETGKQIYSTEDLDALESLLDESSQTAESLVFYREQIKEFISNFSQYSSSDLDFASIESSAQKLDSSIDALAQRMLESESDLGLAINDFSEKLLSSGTMLAKAVSDTRRGNIDATRKEILKKQKHVEAYDTQGKKGLVLTIPGFGTKEEERGELEKTFGDLIDKENQSFHLEISPELDGALTTLKGLDYIHKVLQTDLKKYSSFTTEIIASIIKTIEQNPELSDIKIVGHSLGGAKTREILEAINELDLPQLIKEKLGREISINGLTLGTATASFANPNSNRQNARGATVSPVMSKKDIVHAPGVFSHDSILFEGTNIIKKEGELAGHSPDSYFGDLDLKTQVEDFIKTGRRIHAVTDQTVLNLGEQIQAMAGGEILKIETEGIDSYIGERVASVIKYVIEDLKVVDKATFASQVAVVLGTKGLGSLSKGTITPVVSQKILQKNQETIDRYISLMIKQNKSLNEIIQQDIADGIKNVLTASGETQSPSLFNIKGIIEGVSESAPDIIKEDILDIFRLALLEEQVVLKTAIEEKMNRILEKNTASAIEEVVKTVIEKDSFNLNQFKLPQIKGIARQLNIKSSGKGRTKQVLIDEILKFSREQIEEAVSASENKKNMPAEHWEYISNTLTKEASVIGKELNGMGPIKTNKGIELAKKIIEQSNKKLEMIANTRKQYNLSKKENDVLNGIRVEIQSTIALLKKKAPQLFNNEGQIFDALKEVGQDVNKGLNQGIDLSESNNKGTEIGNSLIKGAKDSLDIHSPSGEFETIGENIVSGLDNGINLTPVKNKIENGLKDIIQSSNGTSSSISSIQIEKQSSKTLESLRQAFKEIGEKSAIGQTVKNTIESSKALSSIVVASAKATSLLIKGVSTSVALAAKGAILSLLAPFAPLVVTFSLVKKTGESLYNDAKLIAEKINWKDIQEKGIRGVFDSIKSLNIGIVEKFKSLKQSFDNLSQQIKTTISGQVKIVKDFLSPFAKEFLNLPIIKDVAKDLGGIWNILKESNILDGLKADITPFLQKGKDLINPIVSFVQNAGDKLKSFSQNASSFIGPKLNMAKEYLLNTFDFMIKGFNLLSKKPSEIIQKIGAKAKDITTRTFEKIVNIEKIKEAKERAKEVVRPAWEGLRGTEEKPGFLSIPGIKALAPILAAITLFKQFESQIYSFGQASLETAMSFEKLTRSLSFITGGPEEGIEKLDKLKRLAKETGSSVLPLVESYSQLAASTRFTPLEGEATDHLMSGVTKMSSIIGLSSEQIKGSVLALSQMAGKGVVSAEELRGQLAERIPGAFQIGARAMKMTEKELYQLMATGNLSAAEFLPKFAAQLELETDMTATLPKTAEQEITILQNKIQEIQLSLGNLFLPFFKENLRFINFIADIVGAFVNMKSIIIGVAKSIAATFVPFDLLTTGLINTLFNIGAEIAKMSKGLLGIIGLSGVLSSLFGTFSTAILGAIGSWAALVAGIGVFLVNMIKGQVLIQVIERGLDVFNMFKLAVEMRVGKTYFSSLADNVENNIKRIEKAQKGLSSNTEDVKLENLLPKSSNGFARAMDEMLGVKPEDFQRAIDYENKQRKEKGLQALTPEESLEKVRSLGANRWAFHEMEAAMIGRDKIQSDVQSNFMDPLLNTATLYKSNAGPLAEITQIEKRTKELKGKLSILDPSNTTEMTSINKELEILGKKRKDILAPLDAAEIGLRQVLESDKKTLSIYEDAKKNQYSDDEGERKNASKILSNPAFSPAVIDQVKLNIETVTKSLNAYQSAQGDANAINDIKKYALALIELGTAFSALDERMRSVNLQKLKEISIQQVHGFKKDQFNDANTGVRTASESYDNTLRTLNERRKVVASLEEDMKLNPSKIAADQLIAKSEKQKGRSLTGEEVRALTEVYAVDNEPLKQAMNAEATLRDEKIKTAELEKQLIDDAYNLKMAKQTLFLAKLENNISRIQGNNQRQFSYGMAGLNKNLRGTLTTDLFANQQFDVKANEKDIDNVKGQMRANKIAQQSIEEGFKKNKLSAEEYTKRRRDLLNEEAQLTQQLSEKEVERFRKKEALFLAVLDNRISKQQAILQRQMSGATEKFNIQLAQGLKTNLGAEDEFGIRAGMVQKINIQEQMRINKLAQESLTAQFDGGKGDLSLAEYVQRSRALLTEDAQLKQQLAEQEVANIKTVSQARMNALQRIKESRDANTEIANSGRTEAITKNSISKFRTDEFLSNNESLAQAKNGLVEIQNQLKNTNSELSELEEAYAGGKGPLLLNDYVQKKRQLLITQAQQESQLATAEMARMRAIEDYRLAMLDRMRDVSNNKNAILNAEALTQLAQSQMTGQVGDSQASRQSTEIALDNAKKAVEVTKESLSQIQKAYRKKELSAEKYQERLRAINLEIAQANQSVAEQELALWKAKEQEKISILEKSLEKQDRLNKLNAIKAKINNAEQLAGMLASGGTSDLTSSIFSNQETNVSQDQLISSLTNKLAGLKGIVNPTKDLQDKILTTEQELNEAVLTKRLNLLSQSLEYKKQMLNATQLENKSIENQLNMIDSQHKLQQAFVEITKKRLENEIVSMERIKTLSDEIGSSSIESVQFRSQFDDVIATKRLKTLDIELKANVRNLEIEQHREKLSQRKAENESRLAVIQAKNSLLIANQSGNSDAIALAQQQFQLANESLSTVLQQGQAMNQLHDTQKTKLSLEHQGTLQAEKHAKIQDTINSKLKTANSYLDKQKERLDSINELNKAINNARTNVLEKQTGISDRKIDLYDAINGTEKITDPKQNAVLMKELEAQLKAIGGSTDPEAMYAERLRLEESLANQRMNALVAEQNMQKTLLQIEFDKYELQAQALILQAKMLALQSKGTENEVSANQILNEALKSLEQLKDRKDEAMDALGVTQETERYNQGIENANAINDTRRKSAEAGYRPKGDPAKYPTATGEAGKTIKELLTGNSQRFGYAPSFDLNQAVKGLRGGNGIDIGKVNIPSPSNEPTYTPLNMNEELLTPNLTENTERNTKAMYDLSNSIISLTEALVNNKPGLEINAPVANNNPVSTPTGQPTTTGGQQVINNVNYGGVTVISSDPTGDARKVLNDLAKANKNRL